MEVDDGRVEDEFWRRGNKVEISDGMEWGQGYLTKRKLAHPVEIGLFLLEKKSGP